MQSYNLDENSDYLIFHMGGHEFHMRYPTTPEVLAIQTEPEEEKVTDMIAALITPANEETPKFSEVAEKANVKVLKNFGDMIAKEFSLSRSVGF